MARLFVPHEDPSPLIVRDVFTRISRDASLSSRGSNPITEIPELGRGIYKCGYMIAMLGAFGRTRLID